MFSKVSRIDGISVRGTFFAFENTCIATVADIISIMVGCLDGKYRVNCYWRM